MTFYEGLTKTEITVDESILPKDINYKGTVTNELVFMLTNAHKKIKSGSVDRKELYNIIKENHLEEACKAAYGKNYTNCSTEMLEKLVNDNTSKCCGDCQYSNVIKIKKDFNLEASFITLCMNLFNSGIIKERDLFDIGIVDKVNSSKEEDTTSYSSEEIDDMFDFIKE